MSDQVVTCATQAQAIAIAAKLNAGSAQSAKASDRAGQTGVFRPLGQCGFSGYTEVIPLDLVWIVPIPDVAKQSLLTAPELALVVPRPIPTRAEAQAKDAIK